MACERLPETRIDSSNARTFAALLFLLVAAAESAPVAGQTSVTAVELLTAFSGESAIQYQPFFQFSEDS